MLEPIGPLPEVVYWRRRALALAAVVVVVLLAVWGVVAFAGGSGRAESRPEPARAAAPMTSGAPSSTVKPSPTPRPGAAPPSSAAPAPASTPPPPPPPGPCPDEVVALEAVSQEPEYPVGAEPEFALAVANTGPVACFRDLDAALQEVVVLTADGQQRVWSSNDCFDGETDDVRLVVPGERLDFDVTWAGRTSEPGCPTDRERVEEGDYMVVVRLGDLTSPPVPFRLV